MTHFWSIGVAQTCPVRGDVEANAQEHARLVRLAAAEKARVVLFPELSLTGYELDLAAALAFTDDDPRLAPLADLAVALVIDVIVGAPVRADGRLHIAAFVLHADGTRTLYKKERLGAFGPAARQDGMPPPPEAQFFEPGGQNPLVLIGGGAAAVAICADTGRPEHPQRAKALGADSYLASMFVIPSEWESDGVRLGLYAATHGVPVALANFGAASGGLASAGRSSLWSRRGELLAQLPAHGAGVAVATETTEGWIARSIMLGDADRPSA